MSKKNKNQEDEVSMYEGCYGPRLSYPDMKDFLKTAFAADDWSEAHNPGERFSTCIWGPAGTAKSSCVRSFENEPVKWRGRDYKGYQIVYVPIAQYEEMGDLLGLPSRHLCMSYVDDGGKEREDWVPEQCVEAYKAIGWKFLPERGVRTFCAPPAWVPQEPGPIILLFDDWNRASLRIIKGVMQLLQTYGTVTWRLPPGSHIVLTGNPDDHDYQVTTLDRAILTRIRSATMIFDAKEWSVWAQAHGLDSRGISWGLRFPDYMFGKERTNARTVSEVFRMTKHIGDITDKKNQDEFSRIALSLLDEETVMDMLVHFQRDIGLVADPEIILNGGLVGGKTIDKYISDLMSGKEKRTDIVGVICDRLYAYMHQDTVHPEPAMVKNFQHFLTIDALPEDARHALVARLCRSKDSQRLARWILGNKKLDAIMKTIFLTC